jgi:hypothetical protein
MITIIAITSLSSRVDMLPHISRYERCQFSRHAFARPAGFHAAFFHYIFDYSIIFITDFMLMIDTDYFFDDYATHRQFRFQFRHLYLFRSSVADVAGTLSSSSSLSRCSLRRQPMSQPPAAAQPAELAESQNDFRIEYHTDYR